MLIIKDVLVSDDIVEKKFICNLSACKGACCHEGDYGAPLSIDEIDIVIDILDIVKPLLTQESQDLIDKEGPMHYFAEPKFWGTKLHPNGACVYMTRDDEGIAKCGFELSFNKGMTQWKKPVSCHLYPIRISKNEDAGFEAWNYDRWEICDAACTLGEKEQVPVYKFLKEAIVRVKGEEFYEELDAAASYIQSDT